MDNYVPDKPYALEAAKDLLNLLGKEVSQFNAVRICNWINENFTVTGINYNAYIQSEEWKRKAKIFRKLLGYKCKICGAENFYPLHNEALHVHHLHYNTLGYERPSDVVILCEHCHKKIHSDDSELQAKYKDRLERSMSNLDIYNW